MPRAALRQAQGGERNRTIFIANSPTLEESNEKPVFFKGQAYKRVGPTSPKISVAELKKLIKEPEQFLWDQKVCKEALLKEIDLKFFKQVFLPQ